MNCRVCDSTDLALALDLGMHPWGNHFLTKDEVGSEPTYPLRLFYCNNCSTPQLDYTVKKEVMFANHTYRSGGMRQLDEHFKITAKEVNERFCADKKEKSVLDIGSNDGTQLQHYKDLGFTVLGVESSAPTAAYANERGIETVNRFFNLELVKELGRGFDVINAAGVFFHLEELHSVTDGIREALKKDGVFVVQFIYAKEMVENLAFDQIYHEHLLYYTLKNIEYLLNRHGLAMFDAYVSPIHGGSVIGFVGHKGGRPVSERLSDLRQAEERDNTNSLQTYRTFAERVETMKKENLAFLAKAKGEGKRIFGYGAPVKGNTLLNYFGVGPETLDCLVEINPLRKGMYSPGMHIPIAMEDELTETPDIFYVLAWNYKKSILANPANKKMMDNGVQFYFPVDPEGSA